MYRTMFSPAARCPAALRSVAGAAVLTGVAALALGSLPAFAAQEAGAAQAATPAATAAEQAEPEMSERQRRREERRRQREEAEAAEAAAAEAAAAARNASDAGTAVAATTTAGNGSAVAEPEMECRRVAQPGSRMPTEVCTPVAQQDERARQAEQRAQDVLRRSREGFGRQ